eukprot:CAMPEP_0194228780 /NCGR_PEP_ID=MMETSP0156-20130528/43548_1 /TAXON_ID=33649 /ORGANISM="Thalassionema nitzschioides, Strain L26-B" /LENGTH=3225 /DNA_ID=CAMNT_0038961301 /DNA_START=77 /DNA_END=9754 /DNA_ORIENTATION=-
MAKKVLLDVLESTIGKYVKNLDSESLNVAMWNGQIELNSLELNIGAVNAELDRQAALAPNLALPFRLCDGCFDSLIIEVPWARISSKPVVFRAKGLRVFFEPCNRKLDPFLLEYNEEIRLKKMKEDRIHSMKLSDEYRKQANALRKLAEVENGDEDPDADQTSSTFSARLIRRIIENIQIEIEDVHFGFRNQVCSAGIVLRSLSVVTTDKFGNRSFVDRTVAHKDDGEESFLFKALRIEGFSFYVDENAPVAISEESFDSIAEKHTYVLHPLSFEANFRQSDSIKCVDFPKYRLSSELSLLRFELSRSQLEHLHRIAKPVSISSSANPIYPEYRPLARLSTKTAKLWWHYAIRCVRRIKGKRMWVEFFLAFQKRQKYIPLYKRNAHVETCPWLDPLSLDEKFQLERLESDRSISIDGIMAWRTIADAQVELERVKHDDSQKKKNPSTGYISMFFGSSDAQSTDTEEDVPITLTLEERRELESISLKQTDELELTNDSWLCDLSFVLGAFNVELRNGIRPITTMGMGKVNTSLSANADGSFTCNFALTSLEIQDMVTKDTLFPKVLRSVDSRETDESKVPALRLKYEKTHNGDQKAFLNIMAIELIASPQLIIETKRFFAVTREDSWQEAKNPMLRESMTGSVDLFFDADGGDPLLVENTNSLIDENSPTFSDKLSLAIADAWKSKTKDRSAWNIHCDIEAPILILPESCSHTESSVLVFDLGHVDLAFGNKGCDDPEVLDWSKEQLQLHTNDSTLDMGKVSMENLSFSAGKVADILGKGTDCSMKEYVGKTMPIIEPVSATLSCGILSFPAELTTQVCVFSVFPSLRFRLSPRQLHSGLKVVKAWSKVAAKIGAVAENKEPTEGGMFIVESEVPIENPTELSNAATTDVIDSSYVLNPEQKGTGKKIHAVISLQRLSIYLDREEGDGLEAHLVSVSTSFTQLMDGTIESRLCMGWFWILDMLNCPTTRRQRLLAHSTLPRSAREIASEGTFNIFKDLEDYISTEVPNFSSELADVRWISPGKTVNATLNPFESQDPYCESLQNGPILNATFASLFVHWNPQAIKLLTIALEDLASAGGYNSQGVSSSPAKHAAVLHDTNQMLLSSQVSGRSLTDVDVPLLVKATMREFKVLLNSAIDDLPLYEFTMSKTSLSLLSTSNDITLDLRVGDLSITTPLSSANKRYHTMLGLAPNVSSSLLTVRYQNGKRAISGTVGTVGEDKAKYESCAEIIISPVQFVYLHAQVMTLVRYVNDGILGAIAARAASSAANAALEIAASGSQSDKLFQINAVGFDLLLPESATTNRYLVVHAGDLLVKYIAKPHPGGGIAIVSLGEVLLNDDLGALLVEKPFYMKNDVKLPAAGIGTLDEQAMRVDVCISTAAFLLSKEHYALLLSFLDKNIGEEFSFLRPSADFELIQVDSPNNGEERILFPQPLQNLTHAGVEDVVNNTRMYVTVTIDAMSLDIFAIAKEEPLARMKAVKMLVAMDFLPDQQRMKIKNTLHNLSCQDTRQVSADRQFTYLFSQNLEESAVQDVFVVAYEKDTEEKSTDITITIGSPRITLIPDLLADLLDFVSSDKSSTVETKKTVGETKEAEELEIFGGVETIEVTLSPQKEKCSYAVSALNCQLVLVDLGSSSVTGSTNSRASSEAVVLQGKIDCNYSQEWEMDTGRSTRTSLEGNGSMVEAYTAYGSLLTSPMQILEPTGFSVRYSTQDLERQTCNSEIRLVATSNLDLVLSMQNVALLEIILSGLSDALLKTDVDSEVTKEIHNALSEDEVKRIIGLASALESDGSSIGADKSLSRETSLLDGDESTGTLASKADVADQSTRHWKVRSTIPKLTLTIVNDLQGLDEPLLRVGAENVVMGADASAGMYLSKLEPLFDGHITCVLTADYFVPSMNYWTQLLNDLEITITGSRGISRRHQANRLSTGFDIEFHTCSVSFSEQFISNLNAAERMWSSYSRATRAAYEQISGIEKRALAASAARKLITSLPYGVENTTGIDLNFTILQAEGEEVERTCPSGKVVYFRFEPPRGSGYGGRRLYGQDISRPKSLELCIEKKKIKIENMDTELGQSQKIHECDGLIIITYMKKEANSLVLHVGSQVDLVNRTMIPFHISVSSRESRKNLGVCGGSLEVLHRTNDLCFNDNDTAQKSLGFNVPIDLLRNFKEEHVKPIISITPKIPGASHDLTGELVVPAGKEISALIEGGTNELVVDTTCSASRDESAPLNLPDPFVVLARLKMTLLDGTHPYVEVSLEPRATLRNELPIPINMKTPMPHTFTSAVIATSLRSHEEDLGKNHRLDPNEFVEVFTPGPSLAISLRCADKSIAGGETSWMKGDWVDLPMVNEFRLVEPIKCEFPFVIPAESDTASINTSGIPFYIIESRDDLSEIDFDENLAPGSGELKTTSLAMNVNETPPPISLNSMRSYMVTVCNHGVDHVGNFLFEPVALANAQASISQSMRSSVKQSLRRQPSRQSLMPVTPFPLSSYASKNGTRISLLRSSTTLLRILQLTMDGDAGVRRSKPFRIEDISICEGGIESSAIQWEDGAKTGYYIYRTLVDSYKSEIHIIPEYIVYNASKTHRAFVRQYGSEVLIEPGKTALIKAHEKLGLAITLDYIDFGGRAGPLKVQELKHQLALIKSIDGYPLGSCPVQTVTGTKDSRLVVKLGELSFGEFSDLAPRGHVSMLERDLIRYRVRFSELHILLNESKLTTRSKGKYTSFFENLIHKINDQEDGNVEIEAKSYNQMQEPVVAIVLRQCTFDWQRIFKDPKPGEIAASQKSLNQLLSPERSQLSIIIHDLAIHDMSPGSRFPCVFDASSPGASFLDLCVRCRGPLHADLVKIDLIDLNLNHSKTTTKKGCRKMFVTTSEEFVWKVIDIADRIVKETTEISGVDIALEWDEALRDYRVLLIDAGSTRQLEYLPPPGDQLYDINLARVSPIALLVTFQRSPDASRYKLFNNEVNGAQLMNYFMTRLKFTLEKADLRFARYEGKNIKGPSGRLLEILTAVYTSRMKLKVIQIFSATNFQDWKNLASRDVGDDEFVDGDLLRVTGNLTGKTAAFVTKKVVHGLGDGVSFITSSLGSGIESASCQVGAGAVGAGVNSVVSGLGEGVGGSIKGVGTGAGKILIGAGKGAGQIIGGVTGGISLAGKGIGKAVTKGDGKAVLTGISEGATSIGFGVGQGVETAVIGAADGVLAVGKGLFSGAKKIGKGVGGAFNTKKDEKKDSSRSS